MLSVSGDFVCLSDVTLLVTFARSIRAFEIFSTLHDRKGYAHSTSE